MFVYLLVKIIQSLLDFFARILLYNFTKLLFIKSQLIAYFFFSYTLGHTSFNTFKEMLTNNNTINDCHKYKLINCKKMLVKLHLQQKRGEHTTVVLLNRSCAQL